MKKLLFLFGFGTLLLTSCTSETNSTSSAVNDVLVKEIWNDDNSNPTPDHIHFTYDGKKIVSAITDHEYKSYIYTGNLITKIENYSDGDGLGYRLHTEDYFTYDTSGRLTEHIFKFLPLNGNPLYTDTATLVYSPGNTVSITRTAEYPTLGYIHVENTRLLHLSGGRVTSEDDYTGSGGYVCTIHYNYDTKNNPFKNVTGYNAIFLEEESVFSSDELHFAHNVVATQQIPAMGYAITATYIYNGLNFPSMGTATQVSEPDFHTTTHYLYY